MVFKWPAQDYTPKEPKYREMTGILITHPREDNPKKWMRIRIKGGVIFTVPPEDIRPLEETDAERRDRLDAMGTEQDFPY